MARKPGTNRHGNDFTETEKLVVWKKGQIVPGESSDIWRQDKCGAKIKHSEHGNRNSDYGWEVDHIDPVSNGGSDYLSNLQPLHWKNNASKSDKLNWKCA